MPLPQVTMTGNLTADPELRFTPSGDAVASFTVACNGRYQDRQTQEWKDGDSIFVRCSVWRMAAENLAESGLARGHSVVVTGELFQREYETREGEKRRSLECKVRTVAAAITGYQTTKGMKRIQSGGGQWDGGQGEAPPPTDDPWGRAPSESSQAAASGGFPDEPPF